MASRLLCFCATLAVAIRSTHPKVTSAQTFTGTATVSPTGGVTIVGSYPDPTVRSNTWSAQVAVSGTAKFKGIGTPNSTAQIYTSLLIQVYLESISTSSGSTWAPVGGEEANVSHYLNRFTATFNESGMRDGAGGDVTASATKTIGGSSYTEDNSTTHFRHNAVPRLNVFLNGSITPIGVTPPNMTNTFSVVRPASP